MAARKRKLPELPATADAGAERIRALLVELFDRRDGSGADWPLMLESLFRAGFKIADSRPDDEARRALMRRVHAGAYDRAAGNGEAQATGTAAGSPASATGSGGGGQPTTPRPRR